MRVLRAFFFFNDTATTQIYTLSLHDALPILATQLADAGHVRGWRNELFAVTPTLEAEPLAVIERAAARFLGLDRKSTRLNSSHVKISYAVFCLKKKTTYQKRYPLCLYLRRRF